MTEHAYLLTFGAVLGMAGFALFWHAMGAEAAVGLFLMLWANNICEALRS